MICRLVEEHFCDPIWRLGNLADLRRVLERHFDDLSSVEGNHDPPAATSSGVYRGGSEPRREDPVLRDG